MNATLPTLSTREAQILALIALGLSNGAISARLGTTERTVKNQISALARTMLPNPDDRGGSSRVRLALLFHGLPTATE
jgi:DNA-binding NarL/FixJ family response regulator